MVVVMFECGAQLELRIVFNLCQSLHMATKQMCRYNARFLSSSSCCNCRIWANIALSDGIVRCAN
jgi:hypothetical protein